MQQRQRWAGTKLAIGDPRAIAMVIQAQLHDVPSYERRQSIESAPARVREYEPVHRPRELVRLALLLGACALAGGCGAARAGRPLALGDTARLPVPKHSHIVEIVMENAEYGEVIGGSSAPYINGLARRYGLASNGYAITHPSLPNYIALTSGTTGGLESDCTSCTVHAVNLVDQLEAAGISWKAYLEDVPGPCFKGSGSAGYAKKHNPFAYYPDIAGNPARCARLVGFTALAGDLRAGSLPTFSWIGPNLCDDGHDCALRTADRFLAATVPALLRELGPDGVPDPHLGRGLDRPSAAAVRPMAGRWRRSSPEPASGRAHARRSRSITMGHSQPSSARLGLPRLAGAGAPGAGSLDPLFAHLPHLR